MVSPSSRQAGKFSGVVDTHGDAEAKLSDVIPDPPSTLKLVGQARWVQVIDILIGQRRWSLDWIPALEHMCQVYDQLAVLDLELKKFNSSIVWTDNGSPRANPLLSERRQLYAFLQTQLNAFGLTPIAAKATYVSAMKMPELPSSQTRQRKNIVFQDE